MISAVVGAGAVVMLTGAMAPDGRSDDGSGLDLTAGNAFVQDRAKAPQRAGRADATAAQAAPDVWLLPVRTYTVTSVYGARWGRTHAGVDLGAREGEPILAVNAGKVILARWNGGYGNNVVIDHGDGVTTVYGHASRLLVKEGQRVQAGERIALVGNTGYSFGAHLHLEVRINGKQLEPVAYLKARGADLVKHTESLHAG